MPGELTRTEHARHGRKSHVIYCRNKRCTWYNTSWVVDQNSDGSIPDPSLNRAKRFPEVPDLTERVQQQVDRQLARELETGGGETRHGV